MIVELYNCRYNIPEVTAGDAQIKCRYCSFTLPLRMIEAKVESGDRLIWPHRVPAHTVLFDHVMFLHAEHDPELDGLDTDREPR